MGRYRNAWGDTHVLVVDGTLTLIGPALPDPLLAPSTLVPIGEHTFRLETKDGFGSYGEPVVFDLDASGKVTRMTIGTVWARTLAVGRWRSRLPTQQDGHAPRRPALLPQPATALRSSAAYR